MRAHLERTLSVGSHSQDYWDFQTGDDGDADDTDSSDDWGAEQAGNKVSITKSIGRSVSKIMSHFSHNAGALTRSLSGRSVGGGSGRGAAVCPSPQGPLGEKT